MVRFIVIFLFPVSMFAQSGLEGGIIFYNVAPNTMSKEVRKRLPAETNRFLDHLDEPIADMQLEIVFNKKVSRSTVSYKKGAHGISMLNTTAERLVGRGQFFIDLQNMDVHRKTRHRGEDVLVHSNLDKIDWTLRDSTKTIKGYHCKYATANYSTRTDKYNEGKREIRAWYTEDIPLKIGPLDFGNLPGLIIELEALVYLYTLDSIDLQYKERSSIEIPDYLKVISEEQYITEIREQFGRN